MENTQRIINACNTEFEANKHFCNKFAIAVADHFNIELAGIADEIVDEIQTEGWTQLGTDGMAAAEKADDGWFVVGGLKAADTVPTVPHPMPTHGHVVIVIAGTPDTSNYPKAIWGSEGGPLPAPGKDTINWAWNVASRDKVIYAARQIPAE